VRVFKSTWFSRFTKKENISDDELRNVVNQLESGQINANLGGGVYKERIARTGEGKSGGYRVILFFRSGKRVFYIYGFAKANKGNISNKELKKLKQQAISMFSMTEIQIKDAVKNGILIEI